MIVEYSFVTEHGETHAPPWLSDSGYFQNPDDLRLIGRAQEADLQQFHAIGNVVGLTRQKLIDRVLGIHALYPMSKISDTPVEPVVMTDAEVTAMVEAWCEVRGE
jgi:hypothetical protein